MKPKPSQDLLDLEKDIRFAYNNLEKQIKHPEESSSEKQAELLLILQQKIRNLLNFTALMEAFGDECHDKSLKVQNKLRQTKKNETILQQKIAEKTEEIMQLQKKVFDQQTEIKQLRSVNKIDISYISSVEFRPSFGNVQTDNECSLNSLQCEEKCTSYYSLEPEEVTKDGMMEQKMILSGEDLVAELSELDELEKNYQYYNL